MTDIIERLTDRELQSLRNLGNECERAAAEIEALRKDAARLQARDAALAKIIAAYEAYRRRGVSPAPNQYANLVAAIDAAMKERP